jgi:CAP12/Pycsar effector protein, TIR domain
MNGTSTKPNGADPTTKRRVQSDFPKQTLEETLRVPAALDRNGGQPLPPLETAIAMALSPGSSTFRELLSSSIKYGLTKGTHTAVKVELLAPGESVNSPKSPEERSQALLAAALRPPSFAKIFDYYKNKKFPEGEFFANTIVRQFGVPTEHAERCAEVFRANMEFVGLLKDASGSQYLSADLGSAQATLKPSPAELPPHPGDLEGVGEDPPASPPEAPIAPPSPAVNHRVFITHASNMKIVDQVKELLVYGKFEPVVAVEKHTVSKPVPDKVLDEMRSCGAAVIHVGGEETLLDEKGEQQTVINPNVLIEIGAAMALYGRNFILLVERGIKLPSNLQGLYEVRYEGEGLDHEATMHLLKSFNDFQKE